MKKIVKQIFDRIFATFALIILSPVMLIAAIGIKISSPGTIFYMAKRMGKDSKPIYIYKFRTMREGADKDGIITAIHDQRVFAWGDFLRKTKIDELPQLLNIILGTMSIVGPRPEDIHIVQQYYTEEEKETLTVLPGLACPGSIFNYTHGKYYLGNGETETNYVNNFLHIKLALDLYYIQHWGFGYDIHIIFKTIYVILVTTLTKKELDYPFEYKIIFDKK